MTVGDLQFRCDPERAALIVVDVQNDFVRPPEPLPGTEVSPDELKIVVHRLVALIDAAKAAAVPVIYVGTTHDATTNTAAWLARRGDTPRKREACMSGTPGADFFMIDPSKADAIVTKHRYSGFVGTDLDMILRRWNRAGVVVTGIATNACVEITASHACCLDYFVTVVGDCCSAGSSKLHDDALSNMARTIGFVTNADEISTIWKANPAPLQHLATDALGRGIR